jgi:hypothetical protein
MPARSILLARNEVRRNSIEGIIVKQWLTSFTSGKRDEFLAFTCCVGLAPTSPELRPDVGQNRCA